MAQGQTDASAQELIWTALRKRAGIIVALVVLLALALRLAAVRFGLPSVNDPDELIFELNGFMMLAHKTLNPHWFGHPGTTTLYVAIILDVAAYAVGHGLGIFPDINAFASHLYGDPTWVFLPARVAMALFGAWCVFLTWRLGRALFGPACGLIAAMMLAIDPVHVAYSQVVRSDVMGTAFLLLMLLATLRVSREGRWRDTLLAAVFLGLTTTTKWPFAACGFGFLFVVIERWWSGKGSLRTEALRCMAFGAASVVAILVVSPYLALDHAAALKSVAGEDQIKHVGATGEGPMWNLAWYIREPLYQAFGAIGLALVAAGLVVAILHRESRVLLLPPMVVLSAVTVFQNLIWVRWALPLLPLLSILGAAALIRLAAKIADVRMCGALTAVTLVAMSMPLLARVRSDGAERLNDTRQAATRWADANIPPGSTIIVEHFGFDLLSRPWKLKFPLSVAGCVDPRAMLDSKVDYSKVEAMRGGHHVVDYGTLASTMRASCGADFAILSNYDRYEAQAALFPVEASSYRELLSRSTLLATISPVSGKRGGPQVRIIRIDRSFALPSGQTRMTGLTSGPDS